MLERPSEQELKERALDRASGSMSMEELLEEQKRSNSLLGRLVELQQDQLEVSKTHQSRADLLGELTVARLNWLEWRSALYFESLWSGTSLQGAFKLWKLDGTKQPSREGNDREGYSGSPWFGSDEQKADESMPDELVFAMMEELPERVKAEKPHAIQMARAYRSKMLAERAVKKEQWKAKESQKLFDESKKLCDELRKKTQGPRCPGVSSGSGLSPCERERVETLQEQHEEAELEQGRVVEGDSEQKPDELEGDIEEKPLEQQP